jgi:serine/threonine protein phosphatase 1
MNAVYGRNSTGRDFVIGDLHGCFALLNETLGRIDFNKEVDRVFSVGDLIDRGPNSMECLALIKEPGFHSVRGNHEDLMIRALVEGSEEHMHCWGVNGGQWALGVDLDDLHELANLADELPYSITVETKEGPVGICHAQPPSLDWRDVDHPGDLTKETMLWARSWIADEDMGVLNSVHKTYHGHTPVESPTRIGNVNFIDTGAFYSGILTCIEIGQGE